MIWSLTDRRVHVLISDAGAADVRGGKDRKDVVIDAPYCLTNLGD